MTTTLKPLKGADERKRVHRQICGEYLTLAEANPEASANRIFDTLADKHNMTIQGIRNILVKAGIYQPRRR